MKKLFFIFLISALACAQEKAEFIDDLEYGKRLYENPRGISCKKCHGLRGQGLEIATYFHKGQKRVLLAPNIKNINLEQFLKKFKNPKVRNKDIMPTYHLTDGELNAIFLYLQSPESKN